MLVPRIGSGAATVKGGGVVVAPRAVKHVPMAATAARYVLGTQPYLSLKP